MDRIMHDEGRNGRMSKGEKEISKEKMNIDEEEFKRKNDSSIAGNDDSQLDTLKRKHYQLSINDNEQAEYEDDEVNENSVEIETHKEGTLQKLGTFTDNICFDMNEEQIFNMLTKAINDRDCNTLEYILTSKNKYLYLTKKDILSILGFNVEFCLDLPKLKIPIQRDGATVHDYFKQFIKNKVENENKNKSILKSSDVVEVLVENNMSDEVVEKAIGIANDIEQTIGLLIIKNKTSQASDLINSLKSKKKNILYIAPLIQIAIEYESFDILMLLKSLFLIEYTNYETSMISSVIASFK